MPISPARTAAFDILLRVERTDAYAAELLHAPQFSDLSNKDHGLATELVMGVLRWRSLLDAQIAEHSSQKLNKLDAEVLTALRMAVYQVRFLSRVPQRAAVHESVELVKRAKKRSAAPLVNAVLRKLADKKTSPSYEAITTSESAAELAEISAHPAWLADRWIKEIGLEAARQICAYNQSIPEVAIRITDENTRAELIHAGIRLTPGKLLASADRIESGDIVNTPAFKQGRVAIQDEGSQLVAMLVGKGQRILDCCAAPGGKTRVLAEQNPTASVIALELHDHRARLLRKLVSAANVQVVTADAREFKSDALFDRILVDVPCSGTGTLARNPEIKWRLQPEDLQDLHSRQLAILQSAMKQVAPGGAWFIRPVRWSTKKTPMWCLRY